jgi:hypothetical protein
LTAVVRWLPFVLVFAGLSSTNLSAQPHTDGIATYRATYELFEGDKRLGQSVQTLNYDTESRQYTFESQSRFRGLLRLAAPRHVVERSEFVITNEAIRPAAFTYEDGTRRGRRNIALSFDWNSGTMKVERREGAGDIPIEPATLDRGSVRVALMHDVAHGNVTGTHALADPDVIRAYDYVIEASEKIETALGEVMAHRIRQQRGGSSRHTLIWLAPSLSFVALRMEQHREGRDTVAFVIESIEWLGDGSSL